MDDKSRNTADKLQQQEADANRDPITGQPGSHPIASGLGAASAGAAGAVIGSMAGPIGTVAGAVIGGLAGGLAGKEVAENIHPTNPLVEDAYWQEHYLHRPYVEPGQAYDVYRPAYQYGWEAESRYLGQQFDEIEAELQRDWEAEETQARLEWEKAKAAARDAWDRVKHSREQHTPNKPR